MKISTKGRYALRLMLDIAVHMNGQAVSVKDIAKRQELSMKYLEQIISVLHRSGFVKSVRGAQGGYLLTRKPEEYTVGMILRLTEGSLAPVSCLEYPDTECSRRDDCATLMVWEKLDEAIKGVVDTITLADLVEWEQQKAENYVI